MEKHFSMQTVNRSFVIWHYISVTLAFNKNPINGKSCQLMSV